MEQISRPLGRLKPEDSPYLSAIRDRVLIFDGALGTNLQMKDLTAEDFGGPDLEGCNEVLVSTRPDVIEGLHREFLEVGVDVVESDSFGSFSLVLAEYQLEDRAYELSRTSAELARRAANAYSTPEWPRFVAGSMGPGTKFPTLGQIPYA
ncbi:MAG: homocysteine S-methyltransferase family protein, partial [Actinomycetes bacterium]